MRGEINLAKQWLTKAQNDLLNVDNNLTAREIPCDTVCYGVFFDAGEFADYKEKTIIDFFRDLLVKKRI